MIPAWKIRRELQRAGQQLRGIPEFFLEPAARRRHDRLRRDGFRTTDGQAPLGDRIALYVIFQPQGISHGTFETLRHLVQQGYTLFPISNAPLSEADRASLTGLSWKIVERPNFGYDFGAYRDGILMLETWSIWPDCLLVMNDSVWFPTRPDDRTLAGLAASDVDLTGTVLRRKDRDGGFLESFLYMLPKSTLLSPEFRDYWHGLQITSNKYKVIRRGERGFSFAMRSQGKTLAALFEAERFIELIEAQDDGFLEQTLRYAAYVDEERQRIGDGLLAARGDDWHGAVLVHIRETLTNRQPHLSFPFAAAQLMGYAFLKKSMEPANLRCRAAWLAAVRDGALPDPGADLTVEIAARTPHHH